MSDRTSPIEVADRAASLFATIPAPARTTPVQLDLRGRLLDLGTPRVMGILNLTPDSFYPGSRVTGAEAVRDRAVEMVEAGADLLDLGAMSSRPGSQPVSTRDEIERLIPALRAVRDAVDVPISVDTYRAEVARAAVDAGADLLNDITALGESIELAEVAAGHRLGLVLMHMRGTPRTMQQDTEYEDVVREVTEFLEDAIERAVTAGVARERVIVDPGIGFGKSVDGNLQLLNRLDEVARLGRPILVGASRKSFIGETLGAGVDHRLSGSLAAAVAAVIRGADILRVHDVEETVQAARLAAAVRGATPAASHDD